MKGLSVLSVLAVSLTMTACQTSTTERIAAETDTSVVRSICTRAWRPVEYDSRLDSPATVEAVRQQNRARAAFCN